MASPSPAVCPTPSAEPFELRSAESWRGLFANTPELSCRPERIEGRLPDGLVGTLYRNGPGQRDHSRSFFDGDGMIRALRIAADGEVDFRSRFVQTRKLLKERAKGRAVVRTAGTNLPGGFLRNFLRMPGHEANTHVLLQGGRLMALEESGHPYGIDPDSLATGEMIDFDGLLPPWLNYSAHPHTDARTGETFNFAVDFAARKVGLRTFRMDSGGRLRGLSRVALPYASFVHDYALSERYMVFYVPPLTANVLRFALGLDSFFGTLRWREDLAARFILAPRDGGPAMEIEAEPLLLGHYYGAWERGDEIIVDGCSMGSWEDVADATVSYDTSDWQGFRTAESLRFVIDTRRGTVRKETLCELPAEFPRIHPDFEATRGRWGYAGCNPHPGEGGLFRGVLKLDRDGGAPELFDFGARAVSLEPVFVPHPDARAEDHGWVLCMVYDGQTGKSSVAVLDARRIADGPVATIRLPINAGVTFHGSFVPAA